MLIPPDGYMSHAYLNGSTYYVTAALRTTEFNPAPTQSTRAPASMYCAWINHRGNDPCASSSKYNRQMLGQLKSSINCPRSYYGRPGLRHGHYELAHQL